MKKVNGFTHIVEQIYYTRNLNIITPFPFWQSLIMYNSTHFKTALPLNSYWESNGSYTTLFEILLQPVLRLIFPTESDVFNIIDNNQKVGKSGQRIKRCKMYHDSSYSNKTSYFFSKTAKTIPQKLVTKKRHRGYKAMDISRKYLKSKCQINPGLVLVIMSMLLYIKWYVN